MNKLIESTPQVIQYLKDGSLASVRRRALAALIPPPRLHLSEWIEREIVLPEGTSALPGRVRLWPYQRESRGMGIILIPFTTQQGPLASCGLRYHLNHCPSRYCKHQRRRASNEPGTRERYAEAGGE